MLSITVATEQPGPLRHSQSAGWIRVVRLRATGEGNGFWIHLATGYDRARNRLRGPAKFVYAVDGEVLDCVRLAMEALYTPIALSEGRAEIANLPAAVVRALGMQHPEKA